MSVELLCNGNLIVKTKHNLCLYDITNMNSIFTISLHVKSYAIEKRSDPNISILIQSNNLK